ncbi:MAG: hypothetical protein CM15mP38_0120 [Synechococcus sp.]|nr:MAG: hypothetical protein CM15mP38_0120 [Synechococcus sp.]
MILLGVPPPPGDGVLGEIVSGAAPRLPLVQVALNAPDLGFPPFGIAACFGVSDVWCLGTRCSRQGGLSSNPPGSRRLTRLTLPGVRRIKRLETGSTPWGWGLIATVLLLFHGAGPGRFLANPLAIVFFPPPLIFPALSDLFGSLFPRMRSAGQPRSLRPRGPRARRVQFFLSWLLRWPSACWVFKPRGCLGQGLVGCGFGGSGDAVAGRFPNPGNPKTPVPA